MPKLDGMNVLSPPPACPLCQLPCLNKVWDVGLMIFQGFKYLDWETVNQAAQSIHKTACQCEIHCVSTQNRKTTKYKPQKTNQSQISSWAGSACYGRLFAEMWEILPHRLFINQENGMKQSMNSLTEVHKIKQMGFKYRKNCTVNF